MIGYARYQNIDDLFGFLIYEKVCTLHELKSIYTLEDAYLMHESVYVPKYNEWLANERASKRIR